MTVSWNPLRSSASLAREGDQDRRKLREIHVREPRTDLTQLDVAEQDNLVLRRWHGGGQSNSWSGCETEIVDA